jgi:hypothetical protein
VSWLFEKIMGMFVLCPFLQLDSDGTVTIEEQIVLVMKAKVQCELNITAQLQDGGKDTEKTMFLLGPHPSIHRDCNFPPLFSVIGRSSSIVPCFHGEGVEQNNVFSSLYPTCCSVPVNEFGNSNWACVHQASFGDLLACREHAYCFDHAAGLKV